jgi:hypothetical protein
MQRLFDLNVALTELALEEVVDLQCLPKFEQVLIAVAPGHRSNDRLRGGAATVIAMLRQPHRIMFARDDVAQDSHARGSCDVAQHVMQL